MDVRANRQHATDLTEEEHVTTPQPPTSLKDWGISVIRTGVPLIWGNLLVFLAAKFPAVGELLADPQVVGLSAILVAVVALAWYALMRKLEPHLPPWLTRIVLGSNQPPAYLTPRQARQLEPGIRLPDGYPEAGRDM